MQNSIQNLIESELKEFDENFGSIGHLHDENCEFLCHFREDLHVFLRSSQLRLLEKVREELVGEIEKSKKVPLEGMHRNDISIGFFHNQALSDSIAIINEVLKK